MVLFFFFFFFQAEDGIRDGRVTGVQTCALPISDGEKATFQKKMQGWKEQTAAIQQKMAELEAPYRKKIINGNKVKYDQFLQESYDLPPEKRTPLQQQSAEMFALQLKVDRTAMTKAMKTEV